MDIHDFAGTLNGRQMGEEITKEESRQAQELGFIVIFGYSDDGAELRGAVYDEVGAREGTTIYFDEKGLLLNQCSDDGCPYFEEKQTQAKTVEAVWCGEPEYSWTYKTDIPHATFDIMDDEEKFCRGIVFDIKELQ